MANPSGGSPANLAGHEFSVADKDMNKKKEHRGGVIRKRLGERATVFRFVVVFALLVGGFNALFYFWFSKGDIFESYLQLNARCSAAVIALFGDDATSDGTSIVAARYSLDIRRGCDAIQASAFFVLGVLASPVGVPMLSRVLPILLGTLFLLVLNLIRIVSLYYIGVHFPRAFDLMHVDVWQAVFIFVPLFLWIAWALRALRAKDEANAPG